MHGQSSGLPAQRMFFAQLFAVKKEESYQYRSVIFPVDRALEGALVCDKWHKDESEVAQILERISHGTVDVIEVLCKAQSFEGWMGELGLTDAEAVLLGWRPEILGD